MALVICPECGREKVSDKAKSCPDCGFPIAEYYEKKQGVVSEELNNTAPSPSEGVPQKIETKYTKYKIGTEEIEIADYSFVYGKIYKDIDSIAKTIPKKGKDYFFGQIMDTEHNRFADDIEDIIDITVGYSNNLMAEKCLSYLIDKGIYTITANDLINNLIPISSSVANEYLSDLLALSSDYKYGNREFNLYPDAAPAEHHTPGPYIPLRSHGGIDRAVEITIRDSVATITDSIISFYNQRKQLKKQLEKQEKEELELQQIRYNILKDRSTQESLWMLIYYRCRDFSLVISDILYRQGQIPVPSDEIFATYKNDKVILPNIVNAFSAGSFSKEQLSSELKRMIKNYALFPNALMSFLYINSQSFPDIKTVFEDLGIPGSLTTNETYQLFVSQEFLKLKNELKKYPENTVQDIDILLNKYSEFEEYYNIDESAAVYSIYGLAIFHLENKKEELIKQEEERKKKEEEQKKALLEEEKRQNEREVSKQSYIAKLSATENSKGTENIIRFRILLKAILENSLFKDFLINRYFIKDDDWKKPETISNDYDKYIIYKSDEIIIFDKGIYFFQLDKLYLFEECREFLTLRGTEKESRLCVVFKWKKGDNVKGVKNEIVDFQSNITAELSFITNSINVAFDTINKSDDRNYAKLQRNPESKEGLCLSCGKIRKAILEGSLFPKSICPSCNGNDTIIHVYKDNSFFAMRNNLQDKIDSLKDGNLFNDEKELINLVDKSVDVFSFIERNKDHEKEKENALDNLYNTYERCIKSAVLRQVFYEIISKNYDNCYIGKYDYDWSNSPYKMIMDSDGDIGQYVLYAKKGLIITDLNLYVWGQYGENKINLSNVIEVVPTKDTGSGEFTGLVVRTNIIDKKKNHYPSQKVDDTYKSSYYETDRNDYVKVLTVLNIALYLSELAISGKWNQKVIERYFSKREDKIKFLYCKDSLFTKKHDPQGSLFNNSDCEFCCYPIKNNHYYVTYDKNLQKLIEYSHEFANKYKNKDYVSGVLDFWKEDILGKAISKLLTEEEEKKKAEEEKRKIQEELKREEQERLKAEQEKRKAEQERLRLEKEKLEEQKKIEQEKQEKEILTSIKKSEINDTTKENEPNNNIVRNEAKEETINTEHNASPTSSSINFVMVDDSSFGNADKNDNKISSSSQSKIDMVEIKKQIIKDYYPNDKVKAMKYYRVKTGVDLKTASNAIDSIFQNHSDNTVFCPFCGKKILRTSNFCVFCGKANKYVGGKS